MKFLSLETQLYVYLEEFVFLIEINVINVLCPCTYSFAREIHSMVVNNREYAKEDRNIV